MPGGEVSKLTVQQRAAPGLTRRQRVPQQVDRWTRYGIWLVVGANMMGQRRLHVSVITGVVGAWAAASLLKNNQARPVRRAITWYNVRSQVQEVKEQVQDVKEKVLEAGTTRTE